MVDTNAGAMFAELCLRRSVQGWVRGRPHEEGALLNRVTEQVVTLPPCNVGMLFGTALASIHVFELHRKGPSQSDLFGSDLAVTYRDSTNDVLKTVFLQFKKSTRYRVTVLAEQIEQAKLYQPIGDRSYVLAADSANQDTHIEHISTLHSAFVGKQRQKSFWSSTWHPTQAWFIEWFGCRTGLNLATGAPPFTELLLSKFVNRRDPRPAWLPTLDAGQLIAEFPRDLPADFLPARAWIVIDILSAVPY